MNTPNKAFAKNSIFALENTSELAQPNVPFAVGVPLSKGQFWVDESLTLVADTQLSSSSVAIQPQQLWPDGSIKWCFINGIEQLAAKQRIEYRLEKVSEVAVDTIESCVEQSSGCLIINCANGPVSISTHAFLNISSPSIAKSTLECLFESSELVLEASDVNTHFSIVKNDHENVFVNIVQNGTIRCENEKCINIEAEIQIVLASGDIQVRCTFTNPLPATHPNGKWDLGDINSALIQQIAWTIEPVNKQFHTSVQIEPSQPWQQISADWILHQASSGKDNWQCPIHVNSNNIVDLAFKGYKLKSESLQCEGFKAQPCVQLNQDNNSLFLSLTDFWQNFPAQIQRKHQKLALALLGALESAPIELQPGEQKSREWRVTHNEPNADAIVTTLNPEFIASSQAVFMAKTASFSNELNNLIEHGLEGESNFFSKRDSIDMYGWRHFGEIYADHENALAPDEDNFVSHYNNQYDPILGFLLQWIKTQDSRWFTLADNLAKHVVDIDVYHTSEDKPDYSGGLFWHTDHYVQAHTATHRTYSNLQPSNVYDDHAGGGGPGGQHCYTQGLTLHYLLTRYAPSKEAVLKLSDWIETLYDGDGTLLSLALSVKNRARADLKNCITGEYPFDRGTANFIHALLDRYELTGKSEALHKVEHVILSTFSSNDDLAARNLQNVEQTWFYTVFCQAVCRYLYVMQSAAGATPSKETLAIINALLHYANWMIENEYLYLDKPDILEFPNQTWTAQDNRKLCILNFVLPFLSHTQRQKATSKISDLKQGVIERLSGHSESTTTRILCLLMQNTHFDEYVKAGQDCYEWADGLMTDVSLAHRKDSLLSELKRAVRQFSLRTEKRQAVRRFPQLKKWLGTS